MNEFMTNFGPLILIMLIFYFFIIRPQMKRAKEGKKFRESIKKGDNVVTIGGIHGKVIGIDGDVFTLECVGNTRIKVERSAISPEYTKGTGKSDLAVNSGK